MERVTGIEPALLAWKMTNGIRGRALISIVAGHRLGSRQVVTVDDRPARLLVARNGPPEGWLLDSARCAPRAGLARFREWRSSPVALP